MKFSSFIKSLNEDGSDSGAIIGKFRLLTKAHTQLINDAIKQFGKATIIMVTGKDTASTQELRYKALQKAFGKDKNVEIVQAKGAYLPDILPNCSFNPVALFCGTDRVKSYEGMLKRGGLEHIKIIETKRGDEDISATKVIANLNDQTFFEKNTPVAIHSMYNEYVQSYSALMSESHWDIFDTIPEDLLEDVYRPTNDYQNIYPSTDYNDEDVRVPGDNENFDAHSTTIKGSEADLARTERSAEKSVGSCVFNCPEFTNEEGEGCEGSECGDSVGTGTSDIATVDNVIGGMVKRKKPTLVTEHKSFRDFF